MPSYSYSVEKSLVALLLCFHDYTTTSLCWRVLAGCQYAPGPWGFSSDPLSSWSQETEQVEFFPMDLLEVTARQAIPMV